MTTVQRLKEVDPLTLKQWLDQDRVYLMDVREISEFAGERIPEANCHPLSKLDSENLPDTAGKILVLCCQSSNRSGQAARKLLEAGQEEVIHLQGGLNQWKQVQLPTLVNKKAPISIMRQVQMIAGSLVLIGTILGATVSPKFLFLSGFVGGGLLFAGATNTCVMASLLAKLPYNQKY
jgi:rhodanese-related sulfurtransferase